jgi:hypothetical protein
LIRRQLTYRVIDPVYKPFCIRLIDLEVAFKISPDIERAYRDIRAARRRSSYGLGAATRHT